MFDESGNLPAAKRFFVVQAFLHNFQNGIPTGKYTHTRLSIYMLSLDLLIMRIKLFETNNCKSATSVDKRNGLVRNKSASQL